jgi:branched-chain amino acid transport system permease protein
MSGLARALLEGQDPRALGRRMLVVAGLTLAMTAVLMGLQLVSAQAGMQVVPRPGAVAYTVVAVTLLGTALAGLGQGRWRLPLLAGLLVAAVLLAGLLTGNLASPVAFVLPFALAPLNWLALLVPAVLVGRALMIARAALRGPAAGTAPGATRRGRLLALAGKALGATLLALALSFPFLPIADRQLVDILTVILIYVMLGWGLNIVVGLAGLLDLGYVAFYAVGAYSYALLATAAGLGFWACLPVAGLLAAFAGFVLGFPVLRLRGDYLAIVTLGFGEIVRIVLVNWWQFTGGPNGIGDIPRPSFFGLPFTRNPAEGTDSFHTFFGLDFSTYHRTAFLYYVILACALLTNWFTLRVRRLPLGRAWEALREDEIACKALGLNPTNVKLAAFACGAMFAGFAGSFFAARQGFISPESFVFIESAVILAIVVLGGLGSQLGTILAAMVLIGVPEMFRELEDFRMVAFGLSMVLIMIWRPSGLLAHREPTIRLHPRAGRAAGAAARA